MTNDNKLFGLKLFKVRQVIENEYAQGRSTTLGYFLAGSKETVRLVIIDRYGREGWFACDRESVNYEIEELEVEQL